MWLTFKRIVNDLKKDTEGSESDQLNELSKPENTLSEKLELCKAWAASRKDLPGKDEPSTEKSESTSTVESLKQLLGPDECHGHAVCKALKLE